MYLLKVLYVMYCIHNRTDKKQLALYVMLCYLENEIHSNKRQQEIILTTSNKDL